MLEDDRAVFAERLIERDAFMWQAQEPGEPSLAILDGLLANVIAVHFQQIEGARYRPAILGAIALYFLHVPSLGPWSFLVRPAC